MQFEQKDQSVKIDQRLERIVLGKTNVQLLIPNLQIFEVITDDCLGMYDRCYNDKKYKQALGIAIEARRLDKIEECISKSNDVPGLLAYCQKLCMDVVINKHFRQTVLRSLVKLYQDLKEPD